MVNQLVTALNLKNIVEDIETNNIAAERDSIQKKGTAVDGAKDNIFEIKIFDICISFPTKSTMLIMNMKEFL